MSALARRPSSLTRKGINDALSRATGYELRRAQRRGADPKRPVIETPPTPPSAQALAQRVARVQPGDRLVRAPAFVLSSVRSGSTLLRLILDSHPEICAPHELHLRRVEAAASGSGRYALNELGVDDRDLRNLLWDRLLHWELTRTGKTRYVNKTPNDALIWSDIVACWPDARFIFLRRHPAAILASWQAARGTRSTREELARDIHAYAVGMEQARQRYGGLILRYEDLAADPERETRRLCDFLDVTWTPAMIEYGRVSHEGVRRGLGDWSDKLHTGTVQPVAEPDDDDLPPILRPIAEAWGYLREK